MAMTPEDMAWIKQQMQQRNGAVPGFSGFGDIKTSPEANQAAQDLAGATDDAIGAGLMMDKGTNLAAAGGGVMSPFEAMANGAKTALGGAMLGQNIKAKKSAISNLLRKKSSAEDDADLMGGMGMGGGQGSVQGNSDYEFDL